MAQTIREVGVVDMGGGAVRLRCSCGHETAVHGQAELPHPAKGAVSGYTFDALGEMLRHWATCGRAPKVAGKTQPTRVFLNTCPLPVGGPYCSAEWSSDDSSITSVAECMKKNDNNEELDRQLSALMGDPETADGSELDDVADEYGSGADLVGMAYELALRSAQKYRLAGRPVPDHVNAAICCAAHDTGSTHK